MFLSQTSSSYEASTPSLKLLDSHKAQVTLNTDLNINDSKDLIHEEFKTHSTDLLDQVKSSTQERETTAQEDNYTDYRHYDYSLSDNEDEDTHFRRKKLCVEASKTSLSETTRDHSSPSRSLINSLDTPQEEIAGSNTDHGHNEEHVSMETLNLIFKAKARQSPSVDDLRRKTIHSHLLNKNSEKSHQSLRHLESKTQTALHNYSEVESKPQMPTRDEFPTQCSKQNTIFLSRLPLRMNTMDNLIKVFKKFGTIIDIKVNTFNNSCYVQYDEHKEASRALKAVRKMRTSLFGSKDVVISDSYVSTNMIPVTVNGNKKFKISLNEVMDGLTNELRRLIKDNVGQKNKDEMKILICKIKDLMLNLKKSGVLEEFLEQLRDVGVKLY